MRISATRASLIAAVLAVAPFGATGADSEAHKRPPSIDLSRPASWRAAMRGEMEDLDKAAAALISVAEDKARSDEDRRLAILLIAEIGNSRCLEFLVANIAMDLPAHSLGDESLILGRPCMYALAGFNGRRKNWNAVPVILAALAKPVSRKKSELVYSAWALRGICGTKMARALIAHKLSGSSHPAIVGSLKTVSRFLE